MPFIDDFSNDGSIVNADLWEQSSVFVNRTYALNPPTIGVATFDGMNEKGLARNLTPFSSSEPSDTLLSKEIDLSGLNAAYLMFYFQGKGIGDAPQLEDKLVLEFLKDSVWVEQWSSNGQTMQQFEKEIVIIDSTHYLITDFKFRFRNYATISGNFDHWHIDYVKVDELLSSADTIGLGDVAFIYSSPSFLRRYSEMPWTHFINNEASELKDSIAILLRNNEADVLRTFRYDLLENNVWVSKFPLVNGSYNGPFEFSVDPYDQIGNYALTFPYTVKIRDDLFFSSPVDSMSFKLRFISSHQLSSSSDNLLHNDTLSHTQNFYSHFAYDDGIAESAYGLNIVGAKIAYQFKLNRPDEKLRAVQMYFPQMLDSVSHISFRLTVWDDNNGQPGDTLYTQMISPVHTGNGDFHTYIIQKPFLVDGIIYIGWEQMTDDLLNVGFDKNNEANNYMFYNIGNGWNTSSYLGSWMIRPIISLNEIQVSVIDLDTEFKIFPNPVSSEFFIETSSERNNISIYSPQGNLVEQLVSDSGITKVDVNNLASGIYLVEVLNDNGRTYQKIIIR